MPSDFWASYLSGTVGILIGNPLDLIKVRLQAGGNHSPIVPRSSPSQSRNFSSLLRGSTAPIHGYGALNSLLFVTYNRTMLLLDPTIINIADLRTASLLKIWTAGAVGGLASWIVSAPIELIKCRTQLQSEGISSWSVTKDIWLRGGVRGLYFGGGITSIRDAVGYGFYFWSYELGGRCFHVEHDSNQQATLKVLLCGGLAGVITWASIFPLDVIKTRLQTQNIIGGGSEHVPVIPSRLDARLRAYRSRGAWIITKDAYRQEGFSMFFRGLGVCSMRAFVVNAVQWAIYEWAMNALRKS